MLTIDAVRRSLSLARSLLIYHGIPLRQRRLRRLYRTFAGPDDLVFDLGAHVGNRTRALARLGCRVIALEPQPDVAKLLRWIVGDTPQVKVVEAAAAGRPGRVRLAISDRAPTMTTTAHDWREAREQDPVFAEVSWNRAIDVPAITLDELIIRYGRPSFVKLDVEGAEPEVLAGLTEAVPTVSFEYLPGALDYATACVNRLSVLGPYRYNWSPGESYSLVSEDWLTAEQLLDALRSPTGQARSGDVYARLDHV